MSTSFSGEPCNFLATANDESSNIPSSSSISSSQTGLTNDNAPETEDNQIIKCRGLSLADTSSSPYENGKEKSDERKKKSSLRNYRFCSIQVLHSMNLPSTSTYHFFTIFSNILS